MTALHGRALRRRDACALSRGGASGSRDPHASPFARGTRAAACGGVRSAGRCVSRLRRSRKSRWRAEREYRRPVRGRSFPQSAVFLAISKPLLTRAPRCLQRERHCRLPHLWKQLWNPENTCKRAPCFIHRASQRVIEPAPGRCYARHFPVPRMSSRTGGARERNDRRQPLGRHRRQANRGHQLGLGTWSFVRSCR